MSCAWEPQLAPVHPQHPQQHHECIQSSREPCLQSVNMTENAIRAQLAGLKWSLCIPNFSGRREVIFNAPLSPCFLGLGHLFPVALTVSDNNACRPQHGKGVLQSLQLWASSLSTRLLVAPGRAPAPSREWPNLRATTKVTVSLGLEPGSSEEARRLL